MGNSYERGPRLGSYWEVEGGKGNLRILEQNFRITTLWVYACLVAIHFW